MTRADLSSGQQAAQCTHAAIDYQTACPQSADAWRTESNTVVLLQVADEASLFDLRLHLKTSGTDLVEVYEPDLGHEFTALAFVRLASDDPDLKVQALSLIGKSARRRRRLSKEAWTTLSRMGDTPQTDTQSVLEHGLAVRGKLFELLNHLRHDDPLKGTWKLPEWVGQYRDHILSNLPSDLVLHRYTVYHDCGKPFCLEYDDEGRKHFPNHAQVSHDTYLSVWEDSEVASLILHDMDLHTCKAADIPNIAMVPNVTALMLVSLAEIHANADMFGGIESTSFKIKYKQLNKRGKALCKNLWSNS